VLIDGYYVGVAVTTSLINFRYAEWQCQCIIFVINKTVMTLVPSLNIFRNFHTVFRYCPAATFMNCAWNSYPCFLIQFSITHHIPNRRLSFTWLALNYCTHALKGGGHSLLPIRHCATDGLSLMSLIWRLHCVTKPLRCRCPRLKFYWSVKFFPNPVKICSRRWQVDDVFRWN
jgi:hypothetical protein